MPALEINRSRYKPSKQLAEPYAVAGINIIAADTDEEAVRLATTQQMSFADLFAGRRGLSKPPIDDIDSYWSAGEKAQAMHMLKYSIFGCVDTVSAGLKRLMAVTAVPEDEVARDVQ